jgi:hypothetical protein
MKMNRARSASFVGTTSVRGAARVDHALDNKHAQVVEYRQQVERCATGVHAALRVTRVDNTDEAVVFELAPLPAAVAAADQAQVRAALEAAVARDLGVLYRVDTRIARVAASASDLPAVAAFSRAVTVERRVLCVVRHNVAPLVRSPAATAALVAALAGAALALLWFLKRLLDWFPAAAAAV